MTTKNIFVPITKVDAVQRLVYGSLATEAVDKTGEIFDYTTSKPFVEAWSGEIAKATDGKSLGNLRAMHGKIAAGKFTELVCNDASKSIDVCAKVVDDTEWEKVAEGVYTGFSIGGTYEKKWKDDATGKVRYTANPHEGSLVDLPCNPESTFAMVKADGATEMRKFAPPAATPAAPAEGASTEASSAELAQVWQAKDGATFATKALAKAHNEEIAKSAAEAAAKAADPAARLAAAVERLQTLAASVKTPTAPAEAPVAKREFSQEERDKAADAGESMPDGSFPIKTTADLKNAIQAFGRAKNKAKVKAHIKTRAKALGAEGMLPDSWKDGADKALVSGELRKGLYEVCRLASLIQELEWLQVESECEAEREGDDSPMPDNIKEDIANLCATLRAMVEEETNELLDEDEALEYGELLEMAMHAPGVGALAKGLASKLGGVTGRVLKDVAKAHNAAEKAHLDSAHSLVKAAGAACPSGDGMTEKVIPADNLKKAGMRHGAADQAHLDSAHDHLSKMGYCGGAEKAMSAGDQVHLDAAHDHLSKMGVGCGMAKAGARHSAEDMDTLTKAHDHMQKAGASCPSPSEEPEEENAGKSAGGDLAKLLDAEREKSAGLVKAIDSAIATIQEFGARLKKLEEQEMPDPRATTLRVVSKSEDDQAAVAAQLLEAQKSDPTAVAKYLMQLAQQNPRGMVPAGR